ncbi:MAG: glycoside hydrolase family 88 protein [Anaerolineae bacterium]|nr:glycoside hydrolase family 88 protein [Anaerolineae bacterium]
MTHSEKIVERVARALLTMQRHSWEQGVAAQAFLELGRHDLAVLMAREAVVRQLPDGRLGMVGDPNAVTDPSANGEAVLFAARLTGDPALEAAAKRQLAWLLERAPRTADGTLYHLTHTGQVWVDSFYMAPPFLAVAGHPDEAVRQVEGFRRLLWDPSARLFHHQWDDDCADFARAAFWGAGNGWAAAGMARVIAALPPRMAADRQRLIGYVGELLEGCLTHLRADGLFHDVVDDADTFVETNLAQMLAYTIYRGVTYGWLPDSFLAQAERMRQAARQQVDPDGLVQGVCGAPHFEYPGVAPEGQAFFLLMEAAAADWAAS